MSDDLSRDAALPQTLDVIRAGMAEGLHAGAQLYVSRAGQLLANHALGDAGPGVPMRPDTLLPWRSSGKPFAAVAAAQLRDRGVLDFDDRVAQHIPAFAKHGKEAVTIRHVLTHTADLRGVPRDWESADWDRTIAAVCDATMEEGWAPGEKAGYHAALSWYLLAEIVRRLDGRTYDVYVRDEIFLPLGMNDAWVGISPERYDAYGGRVALMPETPRGSGPQWPTPEQDKQEATRVRPGSGARGPARELGLFYEMLLNHGRAPDGREILAAVSVAELTSAHRVGMFDQTFRHVIDWGLGFIINSNRHGAQTVPYGYGLHASPPTFGHSGSQSSSAFADPEHQLVVAWVCNGTPGEPRHQKRQRAINTAIYEDLGLGGASK